MAKKIVTYKKQEVVYYTSCEPEGKDAWVNLTLRGGKSVTLRGEKAIKMLKKLK